MESLTNEQRAAVERALESKVSVITGGPGVGKTTCLRALVELLEGSEAVVALASPTGRAAKRLAELTGRPASTLHRLLDFDPFTGRCLRNEGNRLPVDAVIVDEASMLDLWLAHELLQALPDAARLILVGDADQLPPVGPGNVLVDIIRSGRIPVSRLSEVFRQAQESLIITNAHRVNSGQMPELVPWRKQDGKDCLFIWEKDQAGIAQMVCRLASEALPGLGYRPEQIQVITPMHKGQIGTSSLNRSLQAVLNPRARTQPGRLHEQDRVMQIVNNYEKGVFNGDIGYVNYVSRTDGGVQVQFPEQAVTYGPDELEQLQLAYALTAHKSQGSEYPATIILVHPSHFVMLQRNLLYTALTRAMRLAVLVGTPEAIRMAVDNNRQQLRYTALSERIVRGFAP
jgi:exodeoxyribonuclease V alpha subunit